MANKLKGMVSKNKRRYKDADYDLDLSYVTDNIIAMGFPAEKLEGVYRNHIDDVVRFLEEKHANQYKVYNLCLEKCYDSTRFKCQVENFLFADHTPPSLELIPKFCNNLSNWLGANKKNIAAVHCKAGKGRTGVMISSYLLYAGICNTADEALKFYARKRTKDYKGVTIPSQRRYVIYYGHLLSTVMQYKPVVLLLTSIELRGLPSYNSSTHHSHPQFEIFQSLRQLSDLKIREKHSRECYVYEIEEDLPLSEDILIIFYRQKRMKKEKLFRLWFNTFFIVNPPNGEIKNTATPKLHLRLGKYQLDKANKDKQHKIFPKDFQVVLSFTQPSAIGNDKRESSVLSMSEKSALADAESDVDLSDTESEGEWTPDCIQSSYV